MQQFEKLTLKKRLKTMLEVDFKRMFTMPLIYIMAAVCFAMPILILVMTTSVGGTPTPDTGNGEVIREIFTNVWQAIGSINGSAMAMDLTGMCNINMLYFLVIVLVCVFVAQDFKSGYVKNLFTVRAKKADYVISKSLVTFIGATIMFIAYFIGAMIGGGIASLPFDMVGFSVGGIISCMLSKIFMTAIFVAISLLLSVVGKQKLYLSILGSFMAGMLLFTMIPLITPLNSSLLNVIMTFAGGILFATGLGSASNLILNKTSLL